MRRSPFVTCESNIEVLREVGRSKVPWIAFGKDFTDSLDATSHHLESKSDLKHVSLRGLNVSMGSYAYR